MNNMNSEMETRAMREDEIDDALTKVTENDADFRQTPVLSPEHIGNGGAVHDLRRDSLRRSLSSLRSKLYAHSTTSIERSKDYVWDGLENQALNRSEEYISNYRPSAYHIGSQKTRPIRSNMDTSHDIVTTNHKASDMTNHKSHDITN